jgi:threonine dehydrogenase-like Zn-dependent dehydrogenase
MRALTYENNLALREIPQPKRQAGESLVRISMAGICNTDIELTRGYMRFTGVPGHEFTGIVEESDTPALLKQRVVGEINIGCKKCSYCLQGLERHCPARSVVGILNRQGAFAEYISLPDRNLHRIPSTVGEKQAVFVEPLAAALEILEQVRIEPAARVAIIGDGKLALLVLQVLRPIGCQVWLFGKHSSKVRIAERFGAITASDGEKFDVVVEASGHTDGLAAAIGMCRPRGVLVLKSTYAGHVEYNPAKVVIDELTIVGSRCGPFEPAIRKLAESQVDVTPLISKVFRFHEAVEAFDYAQQEGVLKVLLNFETVTR